MKLFKINAKSTVMVQEVDFTKFPYPPRFSTGGSLEVDIGRTYVLRMKPDEAKLLLAQINDLLSGEAAKRCSL